MVDDKKPVSAQDEENARRQAYDVEHPGQPLSEDEFNRRESWDNRKLNASGNLEEGDRPHKRYAWMATLTAAKDSTIYRRAYAANPQEVPLRVWQFCEENDVDICLFDGVSARNVTELEEALALTPPHAHAQIRSDGGIVGSAHADHALESRKEADEIQRANRFSDALKQGQAKIKADKEAAPQPAFESHPVIEPVRHDAPSAEHPFG